MNLHHWYARDRSVLLSALLAIFFTVGTVGILLPGSRESFLALTPFHLTLINVLLLLAEKKPNWRLGLFWAIGFLFGMAIEIYGVSCNCLFGAYHYSGQIGWRIMGVPYTIGLNWLGLSYAVFSLLRRRPWYWALPLGTVLITLLDVLMEPVAVLFNYWQWETASPPLQNYLVWAAAIALLGGIFRLLKAPSQNSLAAEYLGWQFIFFGAMQFLSN